MNEVMMDMQMKRMMLIVNPKAGKCRGVKRLSDMIQTIQDHGYLPTVLLTGKNGDARRFAHDHGGGAEVVCCAGGDGTFSEVVAGMVEAQHHAPIGYIPAGSVNDYASSLGLSLDLCQAASDAVDGVAQSFDIGSLNGRPFAYVAAFGSLARVSYSAPQDLKNVLGHFAYVLEGICDLHMLRAQSVSIDTDDEHIEGEYLLGTISNSTSIGGILRFDSSEAKMDDGYLELLLISMPATMWELAEIVQALSTRSYSGCRCITYRKSRKVSIVSDSPLPWTLDGEYADDSRCAEIENIPNAIRVMRPKGAAEKDTSVAQ